MTRSRIPFESYPATLAELADATGLPVVLTDHYVTRRQRLHTVTFPDHAGFYSDLEILGCIDYAVQKPGDECILAGYSKDGTLFACRVMLHPLNPEDHPHG